MGNDTSSSVDEVNWGYFWASLAVWFIMPLPYAFVALAFQDGDGEWATPCGNIEIFPTWNCLKDKTLLPLLPLHYLIHCFRAYTISVFMVYLWIPGMDIYWGLQNLFCQKSYKEGQNELDAEFGQGNGHAGLIGYKLFEQLGEALPQFVIAVTFYANNAHWLPPGDLHFGIFTMVMSTGSIVMGVSRGCWTCYRDKWLDDWMENMNL